MIRISESPPELSIRGTQGATVLHLPADGRHLLASPKLTGLLPRYLEPRRQGGSDMTRVFALFDTDDKLQRAQDSLRSEEHTSELQSRGQLVCRLLLYYLPRSTLPPYTTLFRSIRGTQGATVLHLPADGRHLLASPKLTGLLPRYLEPRRQGGSDMTRVFALFDTDDKLQRAQDSLETAGLTADIERVVDDSADARGVRTAGVAGVVAPIATDGQLHSHGYAAGA